MNDHKATKPAPSEDLESIAEVLSEQPEKLDRDFWREYLYWSWRCLLFVLATVLLASISSGEPPIQYLGRISGTKWAVLVFAPLLIGPLAFVGWSYIWMWGQDLVERLRR